MSDFVAAKYVLDNMKLGIAPSNMLSIAALAIDGGVKIRVKAPCQA